MLDVKEFPKRNGSPPPPLPEPPAKPAVVAQLIVTMDSAGQVQVNGPIANRVMCLGMLESAKVAIAMHAVSSITQRVGG